MTYCHECGSDWEISPGFIIHFDDCPLLPPKEEETGRPK